MTSRKGHWFRLVISVCAALTSLYNLLVIRNSCYDVKQLQAHTDLEDELLHMNDEMAVKRQLSTRSDPELEQPTAGVKPLITQWQNDHNLVHVVLTRFMQHQPNLLHLGRARLELFKAFCLPTMRKQTSKQFLWIIRADPELHPDLKAEFLSTLGGIDNVVVVGSNARIDDGHFRHENAIADIDEKTLWMGSLNLVQSYHRVAQNLTVLETGLDADDGLYKDFVADIQKKTAEVAQSQEKANVTSWWKIWCVKQSIEWQFFGKYLNSSYGHMRDVAGEPNLCITPGLTRVSTHDYRSWEESTGKQTGGEFPGLEKEGHRFFVDHFYIQKHTIKRGANGVGGWSFIPGNEFRAVRARTPTSAGMKGIKEFQASQRQMSPIEQIPWARTVKAFGLSMNAIRTSRDNINNDLAFILEEALAGQCSEGHSCKVSSLSTLSHLWNTTARQRKI